MGLSTTWTHGVPAAAAPLICQGHNHTLLWREGALHAEDHIDPEAERALAALGGASCACVAMLDTWARHAMDPRVLVLGPRGGERDLRGDPDQSRTGRVRLAPARARAPRNIAVSVAPGIQTVSSLTPDSEDGDPLGRLLALGGAVPKRLVATVAAALADQTADPDLRPVLEAALFGRVLPSLTSWLGEQPELELEMIENEAAPLLARTGEVIYARLPFRWLLEVWARELTTVWGRFVLTATPDRESGGFDLGCVDPALQVGAYRLAPVPSA